MPPCLRICPLPDIDMQRFHHGVGLCGWLWVVLRPCMGAVYGGQVCMSVRMSVRMHVDDGCAVLLNPRPECECGAATPGYLAARRPGC